MMELFSLGADRGAYTEDDVREMARALTGWRNDWSANCGDYKLPLRPQLPRLRRKDRVRAEGQLELRRRGAPVRHTPAARIVLRDQAVGLLHPQRALEATLASLQGLYLSSGYSIRAVVEAILQHPDFYEGPELLTPPVVFNAGLLRSISRPIDTTAWAWLSANAGQQLFYPPNVSGWDFTRWLDTSTAKARWEMASYVTDKTYPNPWPGEGAARVQRDRGSRDRDGERARLLGQPDPVGRIASSASRAFAQSCLKEPPGELGAEPLPGDAPERAAHADRDLPRHAGELSGPDNRGGGELTWRELLVQRLHPLAAVAARRRGAGRGLPRIEPGMPLPAGTGIDRRTFLLRSAGAALSVYGASMLSPRHFEEGIAQASAAGGTEQPVLVSIFMEGGWDALSVLAPVKEAKYKELRPALGLAEGDGQAFSEDENLMWHPAAAGLAELHDEGKVTAFPAIGYDPQDESHFTSRHYWEVGQLDANARSGWMGRYLDLAGEPDNPLQGLSLDYSLAPALATARMPVAAVSSPADYTMWAYGLGEPVSGAGARDLRRAGRARGASPAYAQARDASYDTGLVLDRWRASSKSEEESGDKLVGHLSEPATSRTARGACRDAPRGMPIKCASLNAVGSYDTHSGEAGTLATNLEQTVGRARRLPARPGSAQTRPARADPAVVGVRPPAAGKRLGHRPRRRWRWRS